MSRSGPKAKFGTSSILVLFDKATYDKLCKEVPNYKLITPAVVSERLKIRGSLARAALQELLSKGERMECCTGLYAFCTLVWADHVSHFKCSRWTSLVVQMVKHLSTMRETQVRSLGWEDPLIDGLPSWLRQ